jgi:hypothetical protein
MNQGLLEIQDRIVRLMQSSLELSMRVSDSIENFVKERLGDSDPQFFATFHHNIIEDSYIDNTMLRQLINDLNDFNKKLASGEIIGLKDSLNRMKNNLTDLAENSMIREDISDFLRELDDILPLIDQNDDYEPLSLIIPVHLQDINSELMYLFSQQPDLLFGVTPRMFEQIVAEIFRKFNMEVMLTKRTRDGGYDIIAFDDTKYTKNKYIIECKKYSMPNKVGIEFVQRLLGVKIASHATKAFLVTTSLFTSEAKRFAGQHFWELDLRDYNDLCEWLRLFWSIGK